MGKGAWKYNPQDNTFKHYTNKDGASNKTQSHSISSNSISSLMQDSKGNVWFSTDRGGLCRYNPKEDNFTRFSVEEGMPDDVATRYWKTTTAIYGSEPTGDWSALNPKRKKSVSSPYTTACAAISSITSQAGKRQRRLISYFGSIEGLISFNPNIKEQTAPVPPIYITRFSIFNEEVTVHTPDSPLKQSIIGTDKIVLPYNQANISFDIALLSYSTSQTNNTSINWTYR